MTEMVQILQNILPLFIPLLLIDFGFKIYSIIDIIDEGRKVKGGNKIIWIIFVALVNFGWIFYLIFGKEE